MSARFWLYGLTCAVVVAFLVRKAMPADAVALIKKGEGLRLNVYKDSAGLLTIGYGHKLIAGETYKSITKEQAESILQADINRTWNGIAGSIKRSMTAGQKAAFLSFAFNVGVSAFNSSTMLKKFNAGDTAGAATEFARWNKARDPKTNQLVEVAGLTNRRAEEKSIFLS
jgi:lysozyme